MGLVQLCAGMFYAKAVVLLHRPAAQLESFICSKPPSTTLHQFGRGVMATVWVCMLQVIAGLCIQLLKLHSQGEAHGNLNPSVVVVTGDGHVELRGKQPMYKRLSSEILQLHCLQSASATSLHML